MAVFLNVNLKYQEAFFVTYVDVDEAMIAFYKEHGKGSGVLSANIKDENGSVLFEHVRVVKDSDDAHQCAVCKHWRKPKTPKVKG